MKITFDISRIVPRYLMYDRNGRALARAIEAGMKYIAKAAEDGIDIILDPDKMPEWRLDEMAGEYGTQYDYTADIEQKRQWIKNATPMYRILGTKRSIVQYLEGYFGEIEIEESWDYSGDPFHFRVTVGGEWTPENEAWARKAIDKTKPVRSVLDGLRPGCQCVIGFSGEGKVAWRYRYPEAGELVAGEWPEENHRVEIDESAQVGATGEGDGFVYAYPMAGEYPEINKAVVIDEGPEVGATGTAEAQVFPYPMTSEEHKAGTYPEINHLYMPDESSDGMTGDEEIITPIYYPMCGEGYSGDEA